ncbi:ABC-F family ATP-binding cassette domain-containing protein [Saccharopolyspora griseoalba]|uniref:ABC-F family ATP-binding cassette domain-containing protein n=1 Tax=Saccharopolyspora griseoalba TaxID=1431848 RepID=A0ABW2LHQ9_9PSEU
MAEHASVTCTQLSLTWPDGTPLLTDLTASFPPGRTGLVGANGSGKSSLLRLLAGELTPTAGRVLLTGPVGYLPQQITLATELRVEQVLGIADKRRALAAIEAGEVTQALLDVVGTDWDVEERTRAVLEQLGLGEVAPQRTVGELSGGQAVLLALAAQLLARPRVLLLDEPTNNLDVHARHRLRQALSSWRQGTLVVVSHDRDLLEHVDRIAELREGALNFTTGGLRAHEQAVATRQQAAQRALRAAESAERKHRRELVDAEIKLARRARAGRAAADGLPKIVAGEKKRAAQQSAGKLRAVGQDRLDAARRQREQAELEVRQDERIRADLPGTAVPGSRVVARLRGVALPRGSRAEIDLNLHGPERIALLGRNGSGKTTLLRVLAGQLAAASGEVSVPVPVRLLPQRLDVLDERLSVAGNIAALAPGMGTTDIRAQLARMLFAGDRAEQPVSSLSGGERLRASLAAVLLAEPAPQLLLLDEPTNNLDLGSVEALTGALAGFGGALVIAAHDVAFLRACQPTRWLLLADELTEIEPQQAESLP